MDFLNQNPCNPLRPGAFPFDILVLFWVNLCPSNSFCHITDPFGFFTSSLLSNFYPKSFGFSCIRFLLCFRVISHLLEFSFVVLEFPRLSVLFYSVSISFSSFFFRQYFLIYFFKLYCYFPLRCLFLFISSCSSVFSLFYHFSLFSYIFYLRFQSNFLPWF